MAAHEHHWTFGQHCHIHFPGGGDPINAARQGFSTYEGCATISDSHGDLLFYTDGTTLYAGNHATVTCPPLGGNNVSCHSAIIVPPVGGGSRYHIFAVKDWETSPSHAGPVTYTALTVSSGGVVVASAPAPLAFGPKKAGERLGAISHADCDKYWVVTMELKGTPTLYAMLIESDSGPSAAASHLVLTAYPHSGVGPEWCVKFSPDGSLFAVTSQGTVDILSFDRATGVFAPHSRIINIGNADWAYGVEFSPNGKYLYFADYSGGDVRRHTIGIPNSTTDLSLTDRIDQWPPSLKPVRIGALQLAPNGKIYGAKMGKTTLFEIGTPDSPTPAGVAFKPEALRADGKVLNLNEFDAHAASVLGLPTFTRIATDCLADRCRTLAAHVNEQLAGTKKVNALRPCDDNQPIDKPECLPIKLPRIAPWTSIRWGDSRCDCIEGDDTEVMILTVCNPYRNLTLANLVINQITVVDGAGNAVATLPSGDPSVELVPVGPYCFDALAPCSCVSRQFVLRLRGAIPGPYRILLKGICFEACFHGDEEDCFTFEVCKD